MNVILCCDVDPVFPGALASPTGLGVWECLSHIRLLRRLMGRDLPRMTWFLRSDESIRFATGAFDSAYSCQRDLWQQLREEGHELGWHVHTMSFSEASGIFEFDRKPAWLREAYETLRLDFPVRSARTGWDFGGTDLLNALEDLGVESDLSALPGNMIWQKIGSRWIFIDWHRAPAHPYFPARDDYQAESSVRRALLEIPVYQFRDRLSGRCKRYAWRVVHGRLSLRGIACKTRVVAQHWPTAPAPGPDVAAFFFHPYDLSGEGITRFRLNLEKIRSIPGVRFVTASEFRSRLPRA